MNEPAILYGICLSVKDMDASMRWYSKHWGFELYAVDTDRVVLGLPDGGPTLMLRASAVTPNEARGGNPALLLRVDDALSKRDALAACGVPVGETAAAEAEIGFECRDLDGNLLQFFSVRPLAG